MRPSENNLPILETGIHWPPVLPEGRKEINSLTVTMNGLDLKMDRPATDAEVVAIASTIATLLAEEESPAQAPVSDLPVLDPWRVAARIEALGIVRRIPGKLDLRYMGSATRDRLSRPKRLGMS